MGGKERDGGPGREGRGDGTQLQVRERRAGRSSEQGRKPGRPAKRPQTPLQAPALVLGIVSVNQKNRQMIAGVLSVM